MSMRRNDEQYNFKGVSETALRRRPNGFQCLFSSYVLSHEIKVEAQAVLTNGELWSRKKEKSEPKI